MSRRVTVKDLREEARGRLRDCRDGRQLSKMNKTQLLDFLECIDDIELAREYRAQEAARVAKRQAKRPPRRKQPGANRPEPEDFYPVVSMDELDDDELEISSRKRPRRKKAAEPTGGGHVTYRQFVQQNLPKHRAKGHSNQDAMRAVAKEWRAHKQRGGGRVSDIANTIATGTALAGAVQPEFAPILEPAAAVAKGVGWIADLF